MPAPKLTPKIEVTILNDVAAGSTLIEAARHAGVIADTARRWVRLGNKGQQPYKAFVEKLDKAEATPRVKAHRAWQEAIDGGDWKAAERYLGYLDKRQASPANIERHLEDIFQVIEETLGMDEAKRVFSAIVKRDSSPAASGAETALRLVATR
jgi:Zn-dependent M32 family carboxypeptidase